MEKQKESLLNGYPNVISYECTKKIIEQMERNICKINIGEQQGTGFFTKIPFPNQNNMLPVFITNNHIINNDTLNKKNIKIKIDIKEDEDVKEIILNKRMKYTNEEYDTTIIEIKKEDNINNYLELDDIIINDISNNINKNKEFIKKTIYIIQYPENNLSVSYGILDNIYEDKKYDFNHKCSTKFGSSGSPILNISNKIIGIHKEGYNNKYNIGTFLNYPIREFIQLNINNNELQKLGVYGEFLKLKENIIQINAENNEINVKKKLYKDMNFVDFYDVVIDIKSIKDINKGWNVKFSKRVEQNYGQFMKEPILKIGVIGNFNKGKSFLLSKISKINLPSGTSIKTEGLSIKYPETELHIDRKIVLLDSAGLETPVLKFNEENEIDKEFFKEKSKEKIITELFLQNYIINNSDILIIVVGILTYSEQKLINRIKNEIHRAKLSRKKIFIIHNLITYTSIDQVENYIKEFLLNSATFKLKERQNFRIGINQEKGKYFSEENTEYKELDIYHLIFANEGSEAGKFYNNKTLNFIENSYQNITNLDKFDVISTIKDRFLKVYQDIIEKSENELTINDFDNSDKKVIRLKSQNDLILNKCLIDELGFSNLKGNGFTPSYNYYKENDKIIIKIESPGISTVESYISYSDAYPFPIIKIEGSKNKDKKPEKIEDNIFNSREYGQYSLDIPFKEDDYSLKNEEPEIEGKHGIFIIKYKLEKKLGKNIFNVDLDEDI